MLVQGITKAESHVDSVERSSGALQHSSGDIDASLRLTMNLSHLTKVDVNVHSVTVRLQHKAIILLTVLQQLLCTKLLTWTKHCHYLPL